MENSENSLRLFFPIIRWPSERCKEWRGGGKKRKFCPTRSSCIDSFRRKVLTELLNDKRSAAVIAVLEPTKSLIKQQISALPNLELNRLLSHSWRHGQNQDLSIPRLKTWFSLLPLSFSASVCGLCFVWGIVVCFLLLFLVPFCF